MSNRRTHDIAGALVGGGLAAAAALGAGQPLEYVVLEALGGALVGVVGARLPDVLEPATTPFHRSTFHSVGTLLAVGAGTVVSEARYAERLRSCAAEYEDRVAAAEPLDAFLWQLLAALCRVAAGAVSGLGGGYISHLACDLSTPMGIPLLTRGC